MENKTIYDEIKEKNTNKSFHSNDIKALFSQRLIAFIIDLVLLMFIILIFTSFIPTNKNALKLYDEQDEILESYTGGELSMEEYINKIVDVEYDIAKYTVVTSLVGIVISLFYYVVFPCYNNGQSLGKMVMKIKIKKIDDSDLTMNDLLIRSMINNNILLNIISVIFVLFLSKNLYLSLSSIFSGIQYVVMFISVILIAFSKSRQGVHDRIVKTEVVASNSLKEDVLCQIGS